MSRITLEVGRLTDGELEMLMRAYEHLSRAEADSATLQSWYLALVQALDHVRYMRAHEWVALASSLDGPASWDAAVEAQLRGEP